MDTAAYLRRIGYNGPLRADAATLRALQLAHLRAVPFENLDIALGRPLQLDEAALFDKIVTRRRGGLCYELNGLFATLLRELGFRVAFLSACDVHADGSYGPAFDHLALLVPTHEATGSTIRWLVDVGWGDTFCVPLALDEAALQHDGVGSYRLAQAGAERIVWQRHADDTWEANYRVDTTPRALDDFRPMCHFHQTSPDSLWMQRQICTRLMPEGRVTLTSNKLVVTTRGQRQEHPVADRAQFEQLAATHFGLVLSP